MNKHRADGQRARASSAIRGQGWIVIESAALVDALASLSDCERLDFARWAAKLPLPVIASRKRGDYTARRASKAADQAFDHFRNDGTVPDPWPWEFWFDPCFPETYTTWYEAKIVVRAMAAALATGDEAALTQLAPAFERLDLWA